MQNKIEFLERELGKIKERNRRVEADKAWETSWFRIFLVAIITYIIAAFVLYTIGAKGIFTSALVPTVGFILSTQSIPLVKKWWIKKRLKPIK